MSDMRFKSDEDAWSYVETLGSEVNRLKQKVLLLERMVNSIDTRQVIFRDVHERLSALERDKHVRG